MEFFSSAIEKYTLHLITAISADYKLDPDELKAKYIGVKVVKAKIPKVPMEDRPMCTGTSGKKKIPCKNRCKPGMDACHLHCEKIPVAGLPVKVPQVPADAPPVAVQAQALATAASEVSKELKAKKPRKPKVVLPAPPPPVQAPPPPAPSPPPPAPATDSLDDRLKAILMGGGEFESDDEEEELEEPDSPGTLRHKDRMAEQGRDWEECFDEEDEDGDGDEFDEEPLED
jgi:hypothetical protein